MPDTICKPSFPSMPPTFILGCGRSGTTLMRTMLNHHPDLAVPMEMLGFIDYLRADQQISIDVIKNLLLSDIEFLEWQMPLSWDDLSGVANARELFVRVHVLYAARASKLFWAHKSPRYIRHGNLVKEIFPDAKFIHIVRDPRGVVSSLKRSEIHKSNAYFGSRRWLTDVGAGHLLKAQYPDDVLEIRYQELVSNPEITLNTVCSFLGLSYRPEMLQYRQMGIEEYSRFHDSIHQRLNETPRRDRISAWREELSAKEIQLIEYLCSDLMQEYGFQRDYQSPQATRLFLLIQQMQRFWGFIWQVWYRFRWRRGFLSSYLRRKWKLGLFWKDLWQVNY